MADLFSILGVQDVAPTPARQTGTLSLPAGPRPDPTDALIRTVYAETLPGASREERQAIGSVIANRAKASGKDYTDVVMEEGQFEPWSDPKARARMQALNPNSPEYRQLATDLADVMAGKTTTDANLFYAPKAQAAKGRKTPKWDDGSGTQIGDTIFIKGQYGKPSGGTSLTDILGVTEEPGQATAPLADKDNLHIGDTPKRVNNDQQTAINKLDAARMWDNKAPEGAERHPYVLYHGETESDVPEGAFFVDLGGQLKRRAAEGDKSEPAKGFGQGVADVALSLGKMLPGTGDSEIVQNLAARQAGYDARFEGDIPTGLGRFTGQMAATLPAMAVTEGLAVPALSKAGAVGEFLAGAAGTKALPEGAGLANKLLNAGVRTGSTAAKGAREGALASALVSSAGEGSVGDQIKTGALLGGVLAPVGNAVASGVRRFVAPAAKDAVPVAEQAGRMTMAGGLPVPVPLTAGQVSGAPRQQLLENAMLKGVNGDAASLIMRGNAEAAQQALQGNAGAIGAQIAGRALERGEGATAAAVKLNTMRDVAKKAVDDAYDTARSASDGAYLPAAERGTMTQAIREAIRDTDVSGVPRVKSILDGLDQSPTSSTFTPTDIFDARSKLGTLRASSDGVESQAASKAVKAIDAYVDDALTRDMISGDPTVVQAWRTAIGKRRDMGKLFEGDDLIEKLTRRTYRGDKMVIEADPEEAANYILGRNALGFVGQKNLSRDLDRMKTVLGPDSEEWNGVRGELFQRLVGAARSNGQPGEGSAFSGAKFVTAWEKAKAEDPRILKTVFKPDEIELIDKFAKVAHIVTTPVKGGDNASNSAFAGAVLVKKALENLGTMSGGAVGSLGGAPGAALGAGAGRTFDAFMKDIGSILKARKAVSPKLPQVAKEPGFVSKLLPDPARTALVLGGNRLLNPPAPAIAQP